MKSRSIRGNADLYLMLAPVFLFYVIFWLWPLYGIQIGFRDFTVSGGFWGSPWVGLKHFARYFSSFYLFRTLKNTIGINLYELAVGFPASIVLALMFNELRSLRFRNLAQITSYAPTFLSVMVVAGMIVNFLSPSAGIVNALLGALGLEPRHYLAEPEYFWHLYVWSSIWQRVGFSTIIYTAAMATIPDSYYEAAVIDGARKVRRMWHITLPSISPIIVMLLILQIGNIMTLAFEKVLLLQNDLNLEASEVISTYVYKAGLLQAQFSYSHGDFDLQHGHQHAVPGRGQHGLQARPRREPVGMTPQNRLHAFARTRSERLFDVVNVTPDRPVPARHHLSACGTSSSPRSAISRSS